MTIRQHFPELFDWMREVDDCRKRKSEYELAELLAACLAMYLFKAGSRNQNNQYRENECFKRNFKRLFGFDMPHGDTVQNVMKRLDCEQIERLKHKMILKLVCRKTFHGTRFRNKWFRIAIDGSGVVSYDHPPDEQALSVTSKTGKTTWFRTVLEARLVTPQGFSISIATVWIENPESGEYDKQDCERKAFIRLTAKLKEFYPRLPMVILADGLYAYQGFFETCRANQWGYCVTFKDGNLPSVWKEVNGLLPLQAGHTRAEMRYLPNEKTVEQHYRWITDVDYHGHILHWLECRETVRTPASGKVKEQTKATRFVHITNFPIDRDTIADTSRTGRLRWKIENEGFNTLKNGGYGMEHQYARKSYTALKNYFQFMQMAHMIHQLMTLTTRFQEDFMRAKNHPTLKNLWRELVAAMACFEFDEFEINRLASIRQQFRFSP